METRNGKCNCEMETRNGKWNCEMENGCPRSASVLYSVNKNCVPYRAEDVPDPGCTVWDSGGTYLQAAVL